jgi:hypothetical protein
LSSYGKFKDRSEKFVVDGKYIYVCSNEKDILWSEKKNGLLKEEYIMLSNKSSEFIEN